MQAIDAAPVYEGPTPEGVRGWCAVTKQYLMRRLQELGYDWCPQLALYVWYQRGRTDYRIVRAVAVVGAKGKETLYKLR